MTRAEHVKNNNGRQERLLGAHCSIAGGLFTACERAKEIGCNTIQIFTKNNNRWEAPPILDEEAVEFQKKFEECGLKFAFAHTGYLINLAATDQETLRRSMASMKDELERGEKLELPFVVVHPGSHKGAGELAGILQVAESLNTLFEATEGFRVKIALETTAGQGNSIGHRFEHFAEIFKRLRPQYLKRVGLCVDTAHIFAAGYDIRDEASYKRTMSELFKNVPVEYLMAIHANDSTKALGSRVDRHEGIGNGLIGQKAFSLILNDERLVKLPVVIETPKGSSLDNDKKNLATLRKLIKI